MNPNAALQSASWGIGQIMGENFSAAGFPDVETMVAAMVDSENAQLDAFRSFLQSNRLSGPLQAHDWASFARGYNGPNFAMNQYDTQFNAPPFNNSARASARSRRPGCTAVSHDLKAFRQAGLTGFSDRVRAAPSPPFRRPLACRRPGAWMLETTQCSGPLRRGPPTCNGDYGD